MLIFIKDIIDSATLEAIGEQIADPGLFISGEHTAAGRARQVKSNQQARGDAPETRAVLNRVESALLANEVFRSAARPRQLVRLTLSRYSDGMAYGPHIDAPVMQGVRTDLSFTLFLSDPTGYDGGELAIDMGHAEEFVKLPAGSLVLYPTRYLHQVMPVTAGARLAVVGWVRSLVRDEAQRDLLFELDTAMADLKAGHTAQGHDRFANVRANLLRLWVDD